VGSFSQVFLVIAISSAIAALVGFWSLSRRGPRGSVLAVAACLYIASYLIQPGRSRELIGLVGLVRLIGFIGGILGIIDLLRRPRDRPPSRRA
jgi:hypothetical protein